MAEQHTIRDLLEDISQLVKVHNELREMWLKDRERIEQYRKDEAVVFTPDEVKEYIGIKTHAHLAKAKDNGLPFHTLDGVGARFIQTEVLDWLKSKKGKRQKRIDVSAAM
jgi:hypothetical protein